MVFNFPKIAIDKNKALIFTAYLPASRQHIQILWASLSIQEKVRAKKFITPYLKDIYITSHGLLRYLLGFYTNTNPKTLEYSFGQFGKPFLKNNVSKIQFNMSHSKDYAVYILALGYSVGIDIEWKGKNIDIQELYNVILTKKESAYFNELDFKKKMDFFMRYGQRKKQF